MNILIYGAGNYCDLYLSNKRNSADMIIGIVDKNHDKWGLRKNEYIIYSPDIISELQYDELMITVADWESVADDIIDEGININNISIYNGEKNEILSLLSQYDEFMEKQNAVKQVKTSLLAESFDNNEYCDFSRIIVVGEKKDYFIIEDFFKEKNQNKIVVFYKENMEIQEDDKVAFCGRNFKNTLYDIRAKLISDNQWIILPFFDIKNTIYLRGKHK